MNTTAPKFETLQSVENVLFFVPCQKTRDTVRKQVFSRELNFRDEKTITREDGSDLVIPAHWQRGQLLLKSGEWTVEPSILNEHYYDLSKGSTPDASSPDFGTFIVATVTVIRKTLADGRNFLLLDIRKSPEGTEPKMKFGMKESRFSDEDIPFDEGETHFAHFWAIKRFATPCTHTGCRCVDYLMEEYTLPVPYLCKGHRKERRESLPKKKVRYAEDLLREMKGDQPMISEDDPLLSGLL